MTQVLQSNALTIVWEQGVSDDGSINSDVEIITEDAAKNGGMSVLDLRDMPNTFVGNAGKTIVVNAEETEFAWALLRPQNFTSLVDAFASYKGRAQQAVIVNRAETGLDTVNLSTAELKFFFELADVGSRTGIGGKILKVRPDANGDADGIEYVDGSQLLEEIPGLVPEGDTQATFINASITIDSSGRVIAARSGTAATTDNLLRGGIVYTKANTSGEGLALSSTRALQDDQVVGKLPGVDEPTSFRPTFLYSASQLKRRLTLTDAAESSGDSLPTVNIHASVGRITFRVVPNEAEDVELYFPNTTVFETLQLSGVQSPTPLLNLGSTSDVAIDTSKMAGNVYTPKSQDSVVTVRLAASIVRQSIGGSILGVSFPTTVDVSQQEYNTQFKLGSPDFSIAAGHSMLDARIKILTPMSSGVQLWIGAQDASPVSRPDIAGAYLQVDVPASSSTFDSLNARTETTSVYGMIYNPALPVKNVFMGDYSTLEALQTAHPSAAPGNWANVGTPAVVFVWSDEWTKNSGVGSVTIWTTFEA